MNARLFATVALACAVFAVQAPAKSAGPLSEDYGYSGILDDGLFWLEIYNQGYVYETGIYPAPSGPAHIYYGDIWFGTMLGNDLHLSGGREWNDVTPVIMSDDPEWSEVPSYVHRTGTLDSYFRMDDGHAGQNGPIPVTCEFHGMSWATPDAEDIVGLRYYLTNDNAQRIDDAYFSLSYDLDIGGSFSYIEDCVGFDEERAMPYMYDHDAGNPYIGLLCVDARPHSAYAWDIKNDPEVEAVIFEYMRQPKFDCVRTEPYDWRFMLCTGPFSLAPNQRQRITFALVAGADLEELLANADTALAGFAPGPPPASVKPRAFRLAQNRPNPVDKYTTITFACDVSARVHLAVYDLSGRKVTTLADRIYPPGIHDVDWRPGKVAPGVYLCTMEAAGERFVKTMVYSP